MSYVKIDIKRILCIIIRIEIGGIMLLKNKIILFLLIISAPLLYGQYDFDFICLDDTSQSVDPGMEASFRTAPLLSRQISRL